MSGGFDDEDDASGGTFGGGRGEFNSGSSSVFSSGRGGFGGGGFASGDNDNCRGGFRGGRGGGFSSGRGGFGGGDSTGTRGGFGSGRRGFGSGDSAGARGGFGSGRGGFGGADSEVDFGGGRGGFNSGDPENPRGTFGGRGFGGRGGFGSNDNESSGGRGGGRGSGFGSRGSFGSRDNESEGGRGGFRGGRSGSFKGHEGFDGNDNKNEGSFAGRGGFRVGGFGGRGGFGQGDNNTENNFGNRGRGGGFKSRGGSNDNESEGGFVGGRGSGFSGRGVDNEFDGSGFGSRRGGFGSDNGFSERGNKCFDGSFQNRGGSRGGFGKTRGGFGSSRNPDDNDGQVAGFGTAERSLDATPRNYVPVDREIEELFKEDQEAAEKYAAVFDDDERVEIDGNVTLARVSKWEELDFDEGLIKNVVEHCKYIRPREIQATTIPLVLDGFDVRSQAETGSGKTAAFVLPIIDKCIQAKINKEFIPSVCNPYAIIMGPTRELVLQVFEQAKKFADKTGVTVAKAYGQYCTNINHQELRRGCDILCATPGRLKHFVLNGELLCSSIKFLVLDEADRLLHDSFFFDLQEILNSNGFPTKEERQTLLFSATFSSAVIDLSNQLMREEHTVTLRHVSSLRANKRIKQDFEIVAFNNRLNRLCDLLTEESEKAGGAKNIRRTLVFFNQKRKVDMAALYLCQRGIPATSIHGDRGQHLREQALADLRHKDVCVLIATDVCARGIDIKDLDHVINADAPIDITTYVHRVGRTGRITQGFATTFLDGTEPILNDLIELVKVEGGELPAALVEAQSASGGFGGNLNFSKVADAVPFYFSSGFDPMGNNTSTLPVPTNAARVGDADW